MHMVILSILFFIRRILGTSCIYLLPIQTENDVIPSSPSGPTSVASNSHTSASNCSGALPVTARALPGLCDLHPASAWPLASCPRNPLFRFPTELLTGPSSNRCRQLLFQRSLLQLSRLRQHEGLSVAFCSPLGFVGVSLLLLPTFDETHGCWRSL